MSLNTKTRMLSLVLTIFLVLILAPTATAANIQSSPDEASTHSSSVNETIDVSQLVDVEAFQAEYRGHIQNIGDIETWTIGPNQFGTMGQGLRIEGFMIKLTGDVPADMHVKYTVHVQNEGWLYPVNDDSTWPTDGAFAGTRGKSLRLEAIHIKLVDENGDLYPGYSIYYRGHVENEGDIDWVKNNGELGSTGKGQRLEALEIKIVKDVPETPEDPDTDLSAYLAAIATYQDQTDLYTTDSWNAYQTVLNDNVMDSTNSQTEVDTATQLIVDAQKKLVLKPTGGGSGGGGGWTPPSAPTPTIKKEVDLITETNGADYITINNSNSSDIQIPASGLFSVSNLQELLGTKSVKALKTASLTTSSSDDKYQLSNVLFTCNYPELVLNEKNASGQFMAPDGVIHLSALKNDLQFTFYRTDVTVSNVTTGIEKSYPSINMQSNVVSIQIDMLAIAKKSVEKAEATKLPTDLTTAKGWVDQLPDGDDKTSLTSRINNVAKDNLKAVSFENLVIPENTDAAKLAAVKARIVSLIGSVSYTLTPSGNDYLITLTPSDAPEELTLTTTFFQTINLLALDGVTVPDVEGIPATAVTETDQYTGTITWVETAGNSPVQFEDGKKYTATITLTPKTVSDGSNLVGYTLSGVPENTFTVAGTETPATHPAESGVVTAVFPTVIDPVEIAVKAAETARINGEPNALTFYSLHNTAKALVTPLADGPRKQRFQVRLDLVFWEYALDGQLARQQANHQNELDSYSFVTYLDQVNTNINLLADSPLKTSLQDRVAVFRTLLGLYDQEYSQSSFYQFEVLVIDDAHKWAAVDGPVQDIVANDGNGCQALTVKGEPWINGWGGDMIFDTFNITITKGAATLIYPLMVMQFSTPAFDIALDNTSPKSADTPFNILISGFKDENGDLLNGSRMVTYSCASSYNGSVTATLSVSQTLSFTNGAATLAVTLPASTDTFDFTTWDKYLIVTVENSTQVQWFKTQN
ncbi:hypothetical protein LNN31_10705 [Acetobacterium wieringae]|uniref:Uncharacterized protein n=1 Tax=Acetobacterium wieringae TaxID=52694 RepID=A0ABY6HCH8_9FIRM|nr:hypothetical protein [Acetobacterium wieringae]UYO61256.1 hypothetical protein LNN31_10705 [Acetobacterium wieringae]VUZ29078.1 Uncharacterised protein [Acetobacterium wieringae]